MGELQIPLTLLSGNLTFYLNDVEYFPGVSTNEKISFVTLNFTGTDNNKLEIFGTIYLSGLVDGDGMDAHIEKAQQKKILLMILLVG